MSKSMNGSAILQCHPKQSTLTAGPSGMAMMPFCMEHRRRRVSEGDRFGVEQRSEKSKNLVLLDTPVPALAENARAGTPRFFSGKEKSVQKG